jgi:hypothetical protein
MIKNWVKIGLYACIFMYYGCSSSNNKPVNINFSADSSSIILSDINPVGLLQLKSSEANDATRMNWVSVSMGGKMTAGKVAIKGDSLSFTPEKPFEKGKSYLVVTPLNASFGGAGDILKGKVSYQVKPQEKILKR